ncbi:MAG: hypothetical protein D6797_01825 [Bdellovibrio sp.]|nr:MAG: hypothetical protein D6797_01825 [Bdellovibrio sp.]
MPKGRKTLLALLFLLNACSSLKTRKEIDHSLIEPPPQSSKELQQNIKSSVPSPPSLPTPDHIVLILGPGGTKTLAHTGVIRTLEKARIPITHVVGIGWGSLVAALYAYKGQIHETEWLLYKLQKENFFHKGLFKTSLKPLQISELLSTFPSDFQTARLQDFKVPFLCPAKSIWSGRVSIQQTGPVNKALNRCLFIPPLLKGQAPWMSALFSVQEILDHFKQNNTLFIFIDVLGPGRLFSNQWAQNHPVKALLWRETQSYIQHTVSHMNVEFISIQANHINIMDFENRKRLVLEGEKSGQQLVKRLSKYGF